LVLANRKDNWMIGILSYLNSQGLSINTQWILAAILSSINNLRDLNRNQAKSNEII